jgi:hypothetical protein
MPAMVVELVRMTVAVSAVGRNPSGAASEDHLVLFTCMSVVRTC